MAETGVSLHGKRSVPSTSVQQYFRARTRSVRLAKVEFTVAKVELEDQCRGRRDSAEPVTEGLQLLVGRHPDEDALHVWPEARWESALQLVCQVQHDLQ